MKALINGIPNPTTNDVPTRLRIPDQIGVPYQHAFRPDSLDIIRPSRLAVHERFRRGPKVGRRGYVRV